MAGVYLMLSKPDAYTREGLIVGNPDAVDNGYAPTGTYSRRLTITECSKQRLLSIVTDAEIDVLQTSVGEDSATAGLVPTRIPPPVSGNTSYSCLIHPATTGIWVKTP